MKRYALLTAAAVGLLLIGCKSDDNGATTQAASPGAINDACPFSGNPIDGASSVEYMGSEVGFCCPNCIGMWNKLSDEDKKAKIASMN